MEFRQEDDAPLRTPGGVRRPYLQAALAGLGLTLVLPPFAWTGLLAPVPVALLFRVLRSAPRPGRTALVFGLAHQATLLHWLFFLDPAKTIPTRALVPIQALAAILYVSSFYLAMGWVFGRLRSGLLGRGGSWLLPVLWVGMEVLRSRGELGFSWCLSGSALIGTPLLGLARTSGEIGVGAGIAFLAALLAVAMPGNGEGDSGGDRRAVVPMAAMVLLWWVWLAAGAFIVRPGPAGVGGGGPAELQVAAIQPDVSLADKWAAGKLDSTRVPLAEWTVRAADQGARFIVWPETAVPAYVRHDNPLLAWTRGVVRKSGAHVFTGYPDAERRPDGGITTTNSSGLFSPDGALLDQYAKHHLLPIGEAMPFTSLLPFLAKVDVGQAEWTPGPSPRPLAAGPPLEGFRFSAMICFESIFSDLARGPVRDGSGCLVVITNDGWFGRTAGPRQHAWMARLRAVECGVPVIRCANNGISFIADAEGRILDWLELGRRGMVAARIIPGDGGTLYVMVGAWPLLGFVAAWVLLAVARERGGGRRP